MSYISDIKSVFEAIHTDGSFLFYSEVVADSKIMSISKDNYPVFVIDDEIDTEVQINTDSGGQISPRLKIYCLTKYNGDDEVNEANSTRTEQFEWCVKPMESLAIRVMAKYMREFPESVLRERAIKPKFKTTHKYNLWGSALYGVEMDVLNLTIREIINYCNT